MAFAKDMSCGALSWIKCLSTLIITLAACASAVGSNSSDVRPTPAGHTFQSNVMWDRPDGGCDPASVPRGDKCNVCDLANPTDCYERCVAGNGDSCAVDGRRRARDGDLVEAALSYERGCGLGSGSGCELLALAMMRGKGRFVDEKEGMNLFEKMCNFGRGLACTHFSVGLFAGRGRVRDIDAADKFLTRACSLGDPFGCQLRRDERRFSEIDRAVHDALTRVINCNFGKGDDCSTAVSRGGLELQ